VGTVILPIGLGATALSRLLAGHHFGVFSVMGVLMFAGGVAMMLGAKLMLRCRACAVPARASAACTCWASSPVLRVPAAPRCWPGGCRVRRGRIVPGALGLGVTYVFGMVAPLCVLALLWDRRDWGSSRLFTAAKRPVRIGRRRVPLSSSCPAGC